jgi:hypothetical protein
MSPFEGGVSVGEASTGTAARVALPRWADWRMLLGLLLVLVAVVGGARVFAAAQRRTDVWAAEHALVPGERIAPGDLDVERVRLGTDSARYAAAVGAAPVGYLVTRYIGAGELLPVGALSADPPTSSSRLVTVPVQAGHLPPDLNHGAVVDVYVTAKSATGSVGAPTLVVSGVTVQSRSGGGAFAEQAQLAVVLVVPTNDVPALVRAVESGSIDLVEVPGPDGGR